MAIGAKGQGTDTQDVGILDVNKLGKDPPLEPQRCTALRPDLDFWDCG